MIFVPNFSAPPETVACFAPASLKSILDRDVIRGAHAFKNKTNIFMFTLGERMLLQNLKKEPKERPAEATDQQKPSQQH